MNTNNYLKETAFDWCIVPEDLPKSNLFFVVAKTASPTIHPEDKEDPIRLFSELELELAARSLARRPMGLNHIRQGLKPLLIDKAFTVDAQYNKSTHCVEAMIYVPDQFRDKINAGEIYKVSVEYVWRDIRKTELGSEFIGLVFDKIDLVEGLKAGDTLSEIRNVESVNPEEMKGFIAGDIKMETEAPPEQEMKQEMITEGLKKPEQGFYCDEKKRECSCVDCKKVECSYDKKEETSIIDRKEVFDAQQKPEATNLLQSVIEAPILNQAPVDNSQPQVNVASAGMVTKEGGEPVMFGVPEEKKEGSTLNDSTPVISSNEINVIGMDESKQKVEAVVPPVEPKKEEKKPEEKKPDVPPTPPVVETPPVDYKAKFEASSKHEAELDAACKRLQDNAKLSEDQKKAAVAEAYKKGKQDVISNVKEVLPDSSMFNYNIRNGTRAFVDSVKKRLYECEQKT